MNVMSKKYYIKTFGCQMNVSDSERIAGFLESQKFKPTDDIKKADLVVFNTCGVRQTAEDRVYGNIHNLRTKNYKLKTIILTGCLANRKDVQRRLKDKVDLFCEIKDFPNVMKKLTKFSLFGKGGTKRGFEKLTKYKNPSLTLPFKKGEKYLSIIPKYSSKHSAYVPIMTGCNNFCSYCVVPYTRGREISRSAKEIIYEIKELAENGYKEIILLGQNVNSYISPLPAFASAQSTLPLRERGLGGEGKNINFAKLLNHLAKTFPQIRFKFLTSHPKDFSNELIKFIAKNKNISREIHLPVQSGSDKILKLMNRPYTQKQYLNLIQKIKKSIPEAAFTTDVIVGFPGETKKDFGETVKVFKKVKYNEAYINKYSPRPGTAAWKLGDPISWEEKKRREKILRKLIR
jgi:tRNA-2-methylthio-N6-dimethylallyladenosine synthase